MKFTKYVDPAHGWLKVSHKLVKELGIEDKISSCSYMTHNAVFLEEDGDFLVFAKAMNAAGKDVEMTLSFADRPSKIRKYPSYDKTKLGGYKVGQTITLWDDDDYKVTGTQRRWFIVKHLPSGMVYRLSKTNFF